MSQLSLYLIEENKRSKNPVLDLGYCGLTQVPETLFDCIWLKELVLSDKYWDEEKRKWVESKNKGTKNNISAIPVGISELQNLVILKAGGQFGNRWNIPDTSFLKGLPSLRSLDLSYTQINDCSFAEYLTHLQYLNLSYNQIKDYSYLKNLARLESLTLRGISDSDYSFLKTLTFLRSLDLQACRAPEAHILKTLKELQSLDLSYAWISDCSFLEGIISLRSLYLSGNQISDFYYSKQFSGLQHLDLSYNKIENSRFLENFTSLQSLDLCYNSIHDIRFLEKLTSLQSLNISFNKILDIHSLKKLTFLQSLDLRYNFIHDYKPLEEMTHLQSLYLGSTQISDYSFLKKLTHLKSLDLSFTGITDTDFLENLTSLQSLDFGNNKISGIRFLEKLTRLQFLDLRSNHITDISHLEKLTRLQVLYLGSNEIADIRSLKKLTELRFLDLNNNHISDIDTLFSVIHLDHRNVYLQRNDVLKSFPEEVLQIGWSAIRERLLSLQQKEGFKVLKEIKLLLLGNTNVGKSNLLEYFESGKTPQQHESTHGIQYRALTNIVEDGIINCWDFGGQDFFHATHQLFFSPGALHVILWSKEDIVRKETDVCFDLDYWLRCIEHLIKNFYGSSSKKIEVIVAENKIDLQGFKHANKNQDWFAKKFFNLNLIFTHINLRPLRRMETFKELLAESMRGLFAEHSNTYYDYLSLIRRSSAPFILITDISSDDPEKIQTAIEVFHNMGILLYFGDIIPGKIFNKPQLLLDLLYQKILSKEKKYQLSEDTINEAIKDNDLELKLNEVLALMKRFDLVFQIPVRSDTYFIPQYLPDLSDKTRIFLEHIFSPANIRIQSDHYLMNLTMLKIYTVYGRYVKEENPDEYLFWKDGIVIIKNGEMLMIKFDRKAQVIELFPSKTKNNSDLRNELTQYILNIRPESDPKESISEWKEENIVSRRHEINWQSHLFDVYVSIDGVYFVLWTNLIAQSEKGFDRIEATPIHPNNTPTISQHRILPISDFKQFLPDNRNLKIRKNVFISYSHNDITHREEFEKFLINPVRDELINVWQDGLIQAGDDWNKKIKEAIDKTDIFILLVSQDLIKSEYVNEKELRIILEKRMKENCRIVFVLLKDCDWENWKVYPQNITHNLTAKENENHLISRFQFLPLNKGHVKAVNKWEYEEEAWLQVVTAVKNFCDNTG